MALWIFYLFSFFMNVSYLIPIGKSGEVFTGGGDIKVGKMWFIEGNWIGLGVVGGMGGLWGKGNSPFSWGYAKIGGEVNLKNIIFANFFVNGVQRSYENAKEYGGTLSAELGIKIPIKSGPKVYYIPYLSVVGFSDLKAQMYFINLSFIGLRF